MTIEPGQGAFHKEGALEGLVSVRPPLTKCPGKWCQAEGVGEGNKGRGEKAGKGERELDRKRKIKHERGQ